MLYRMNSSSSDSEFDYEADEQEKLLYMQLYFGENADPVESPAEKSLGNPCAKTSALPSSHISSSNVLDVASHFGDDSQALAVPSNEETTPNDEGNKNKTTISNPPGKSADSPHQNDGNTSPVLLKNPKNASISLRQKSSKKQKHIRNSVKATKPFKRKRSLSQGSSISGSEPLDNLYLLDSDDDLSPMELSQITEVPEDIRDEDSRYSVVLHPKQTNHETLITISDSDYSSDEEIFILPKKPKTYDSIEIGSETEDNNSKDSIEIIQENLKSRKIATPRQRESKFPKGKKATHERAVVLSSDISDSEYVSVGSPKKPVLFSNVKLPLTPKVTRRSSSLRFVKSNVIFSKVRPLSGKQPSCPTWTKEMASFYDSDISDEFSVGEVHASQSDLPRNWRICQEDKSLVFQKRRKTRYFERRCPRCKETDHTLKKCPKVPHCLYCGSSSHPHYRMCPHICCLRCGGEPHGYCFLTDKQRICSECGNSGHVAELCPDLWRRFHATTSGNVPLIPKHTEDLVSRPRYCWNCGAKGHYGHECKRNQFSRYVPISTEVFSYDPLVSTEAPSNEHPSNEHPSNEHPSNEHPVNVTPVQDTKAPRQNVVIISTVRTPSAKRETQLIRRISVPLNVKKALKRKNEKRLNNVRCWSLAQIDFIKKNKRELKIQGPASVVETATRLLKEIHKELTAIQEESSKRKKITPTALPGSQPLSLPKTPKCAAAAIAKMTSVEELDSNSHEESVKDILKFFASMGADGPGVPPTSLRNNDGVEKRMRQLSKILYPICRVGQFGKEFEKLLRFRIDLKRRVTSTKDEVFRSLASLYSKIVNPAIGLLPKMIEDAHSFLSKGKKRKKLKQEENNHKTASPIKARNSSKSNPKNKLKKSKNNRESANSISGNDSFETNPKSKVKKMKSKCKAANNMNEKDSFESNSKRKLISTGNSCKTAAPINGKKPIQMRIGKGRLLGGS